MRDDDVILDGSRAEACLEFATNLVRKMPFIQTEDQVRLATTAMVMGISLGLSIGQIEPKWASVAYEEVIEWEAGFTGTTPEDQRLTDLYVAQALVRGSRPVE